MVHLSTSAIIVIVIVACLAAVSLGAALFKQYYPESSAGRFNYPREQELYMRSVRMNNMGHFRRESMMKDVEMGYGPPMMSPRY
ncbi:hypothetical protein FE257_005375 [Aspergillus nanangensis]|uniref:Uncharacterized protein n=1 Tax=Aspergillus nanangensis TaxID=2582783 RepID=A0AAD4GUN5_ASPNN|nr:hypothetical protein FE257_005375 [Aspergillus nanangensis]